MKANFANVNKAVTILNERYPTICSGIIGDSLDDKSLYSYSEMVLQYYVKYIGDPFAQNTGIDSFARISYDFILLQSRFNKLRQYKNKSAKQLEMELYSDSKKMEGYYLSGLFLTYAFWPNHIKILRFFIEKFLRNQPDICNYIEVGVGHGLMPLTLLKELDNSIYHGIDISVSSINATKKLLENACIHSNRYSFELIDATSDIVFSQSKHLFKAGICCEVLEHVEDPSKILRFLRQRMIKNSQLFITTVTNIAAEDHIYLFKNQDEIHELFNKYGFHVKEEMYLPLQGYENADYIPANYAAILI